MSQTNSLHQYQALLEVSEAIARHSDLPSLIQDLACCLPKVIPTDFLALTHYDVDRQVIRLRHVH